MNGFTSDWLTLREPFDRAARAAAATTLDLPSCIAGRSGDDGMLSAIDLACGTGANLRELAPRLGGAQRWRLIDHDPLLLNAVAPALARWASASGHRFEQHGDVLHLEGRGENGLAFAAAVQTLRLDLARDLHTLPFADTQLVTASALLDLVSADWLRALIDQAGAARCALLFALNVDGRTAWDPTDGDDELVHTAFAAHQRRDKGFLGPALGGQAVEQAVQSLNTAGYRVFQPASDWIIDASQPGPSRPAAAALQRAMIEGMAAAASEQATENEAAICAWRERRLALLERSRLRVGHTDLIAVP
ncbi:MAG: SAM-dependent methyltransferase [Methylibium sp.]|uniref:class I SAM-dependent methyltransferase n=1 Tax=Methylibium sp. TaxID=2067992 RepID=UPI00181DE7A9|nr:class I SAM-dependent methyltransferase [Methylibium sp.]MBA3598428.1 SAM-dependent methyltransferase [Methylibium sp.]